ncbi:hypothetical protein SDC9_100092 [bioreactor metagenome]|uniref:Uncharacterized protein n=1 Tax=bioreactor metagenome TaxID=1076179 RepID=A0A645AJC5_9ZZZZ
MLLAQGNDGDILGGITKDMQPLDHTVCDGFGRGHHDIGNIFFE